MKNMLNPNMSMDELRRLVGKLKRQTDRHSLHVFLAVIGAAVLVIGVLALIAKHVNNSGCCCGCEDDDDECDENGCCFTDDDDFEDEDE